ncbi:MAG TPA: hypothetical protein VF807_08930 [Ktedonobacterales bacterium]
MEELRRDEVISLATDVSLGEVAHPSVQARGAGAEFLLGLASLTRPGTLLFAGTPGLATLLLIWHGSVPIAPLPAVSAIAAPMLGLAGANALDLARKGWLPRRFSRAQAFPLGILLLLCGAGAGIPLAMLSSRIGLSLGVGLAIIAVGYVATERGIRESVLGDVAVLLGMGPVLAIVAALGQHRALGEEAALVSVALGCLALATLRARRLRDLAARKPQSPVWLARWSIGALYVITFALVGYVAARPHGPHPALLIFIAFPEAVIAAHGALHAGPANARQQVMRATLGVALRATLALLVGLALNGAALLMLRSGGSLWHELTQGIFH